MSRDGGTDAATSVSHTQMMADKNISIKRYSSGVTFNVAASELSSGAETGEAETRPGFILGNYYPSNSGPMSRISLSKRENPSGAGRPKTAHAFARRNRP